MGQALLDGIFEKFRAKIEALDVAVDGPGRARRRTCAATRLELAWEARC